MSVSKTGSDGTHLTETHWKEESDDYETIADGLIVRENRTEQFDNDEKAVPRTAILVNELNSKNGRNRVLVNSKFWKLFQTIQNNNIMIERYSTNENSADGGIVVRICDRAVRQRSTSDVNVCQFLKLVPTELT